MKFDQNMNPPNLLNLLNQQTPRTMCAINREKVLYIYISQAKYWNTVENISNKAKSIVEYDYAYILRNSTEVSLTFLIRWKVKL